MSTEIPGAATLVATDCVVLTDHPVTDDRRVAHHAGRAGHTRHAIPRRLQDAEQVVRL